MMAVISLVQQRISESKESGGHVLRLSHINEPFDLPISKILRDLPNVRRLLLHGSLVTSIEGIAQLSNLVEVRAPGCRHLTSGVAELGKLSSSLEILDLSEVPINNPKFLGSLTLNAFIAKKLADIDVLSALQKMSSLRQLDVGGIQFARGEEQGDQAIDVISNLNTLEYLDIGGLAAHAHKWDTLRRLTKLRVLRMRGCNLVDLEFVRALGELEILDLPKTKSLRSIDALEDCKKLASLVLTGSSVRSLQPICNLKTLSADVKASPLTFGLHFADYTGDHQIMEMFRTGDGSRTKDVQRRLVTTSVFTGFGDYWRYLFGLRWLNSWVSLTVKPISALSVIFFTFYFREIFFVGRTFWSWSGLLMISLAVFWILLSVFEVYFAKRQEERKVALLSHFE